MAAKTLHSFFLDAQLSDGLKRVKQREGIGEGEQVRRALRDWLDKRQAAPVWRSGRCLPVAFDDLSSFSLGSDGFWRDLTRAFPDGLPADVNELREYVNKRRQERLARHLKEVRRENAAERRAAKARLAASPRRRRK